MAIKLTTTAESTNFVKCLVYGDSGIGKTTLCKTAPKPLIISAEKGLLSLSDQNIPVVEIENHMDLEEAYQMVLTDPKFSKFETICLDSISDIAESVLAYFKANPVDGNTNPMAAYGQLADSVLPMIKKFRDLPDKHVYFTAKAKRVTDSHTGVITWVAAMPGQQLGPALPYLFDFVLPMRIAVDKDNNEYRYLQTLQDFSWLAKDRSGKLSPKEEPNLSKLFSKALNRKIKRKET